MILGLGLALTIGTPFPQLSGRPTRTLFEASVVLLGFGTDLTTVYQALKSGVLFIIPGTFALFIMWYAAGRIFGLDRRSVIISRDEFGHDNEPVSGLMAVSLIFGVLGLVTFPFISLALGLTAKQTGVWSAMAVPLVPAAIGLPQTFGHDAVNMAVPLVLVRVLLTATASFLVFRKEPEGRRSPIPWFVLLFVLVTVFRTYAPVSIFPSIFDSFVNLGNAGIVLSLFLIGASLSAENLKKLNIRSVVVPMALLIIVSALSLAAVLRLL
jgi:uncharacterized membrane protein YadS